MERSQWVAKGLNVDICDTHPIRKTLLHHPRNIVQLTSIRMYGGYKFARQTSSAFNSTMERHYIHGLNGARCNDSEAAKVYPKCISLPLANDNNETKKNQSKNTKQDSWVQIVMSDFFGMQAGLATESILWSHYKKPGEALDSNLYLHQFYHVNSNTLEFTLVSGSQTINGRIIKRKILEYRDLLQPSNQQIKSMITLTDQNKLLCWDMNNNWKTTDDIQLSVNNELADNYSYVNFEFIEEEEILIVIGKEKYRDTQCILIFNYPPEMTNVSVIHTSHLGMEFNFYNPYCFMYQESRDLIVSSWQSFFGQTRLIPPTGFNPIIFDENNPTRLIQFSQEWTITDLPASNINMYLQTPNVDFVNISPSMIYKYVFDGIQFFTLTPSGDEAELPKYQFRGLEGQLGDGHSRIIPFPDQSSRIVISNSEIFEDAVVTFDLNGRGQRSPTPFYSEPNNVLLDSASANLLHRKECIMGLAYCKTTNLLAVLFCKNHSFQVKLYHPNSLELAKALPSVKRNCAWRFTINISDCVFMSFESDMILVEFVFNNNGINPIREVYICSLLQEKIPQL